jgi:hypothetical protein
MEKRKETKDTRELEEILGRTHIANFGAFVKQNRDQMMDDISFSDYMKDLIKEKGYKLKDVFIRADIPERYGYKLLSEQKTTAKRVVLYRICYAAGFTLKETQRAYKKYGLRELYIRYERDAFLIAAMNERFGSLYDIDQELRKRDLDPLETCGVEEKDPPEKMLRGRMGNEKEAESSVLK